MVASIVFQSSVCNKSTPWLLLFLLALCYSVTGPPVIAPSSCRFPDTGPSFRCTSSPAPSHSPYPLDYALFTSWISLSAPAPSHCPHQPSLLEPILPHPLHLTLIIRLIRSISLSSSTLSAPSHSLHPPYPLHLTLLTRLTRWNPSFHTRSTSLSSSASSASSTRSHSLRPPHPPHPLDLTLPTLLIHLIHSHSIALPSPSPPT